MKQKRTFYLWLILMSVSVFAFAGNTTLYYVDYTDIGGNFYAYLTDNNQNDAPYKPYPGELMTPTGGQVNGHAVFSCTVPGNYNIIRFIRNQNQNISDDLEIFRSGSCYYNGTWYNTIADVPDDNAYYTLTIKVNNGNYGHVEGSASGFGGIHTGSQSFPRGTQILLTATANGGKYRFLQWSDKVLNPVRELYLYEDMEITALFENFSDVVEHVYSWDELGVARVSDGSSQQGIMVYQYQFFEGYEGSVSYPAISFGFCVDKGFTYNNDNNDRFVGPKPGYYPVNANATQLKNSCLNQLICNANFNSSGGTRSGFWASSGNKQLFTSGSVLIEPGRHGRPFIWTSTWEDEETQVRPQFIGNNNYRFDIRVGDYLHMVNNYNQVIVAKNSRSRQMVLYANDGNNYLRLIFDVAGYDSAIGIPSGGYTIGTNVWGSLMDADGLTDWKLTSGKIFVTRIGNNLYLNTSGLFAQVRGENFDPTDIVVPLDLRVSGIPTFKSLITIPIGMASLNDYDEGYFNIIGSQGNYEVSIESYGVPFHTGYYARYELDNGQEYTYLGKNNKYINLIYASQQALVRDIDGQIVMEAYLVSSDTRDVYQVVATLQSDTYAINYRDYGGFAYSGSNIAGLPDKHTYGTSTDLVQGIRTGYTFVGWYTNAECTGEPVTVIGATDISEDITLYAKWVSDLFEIVWKSENGDFTLETDHQEFGSHISYNGPMPWKENSDEYTYIFDGWSLTANGELAFPAGATPEVNGNITYYAHFSQQVNSYTVTIVSNNPEYGVVSLSSVMDVPYGTVIDDFGNELFINGSMITPLTMAPTAEYTYVFEGWSPHPDFIENNIVIIANFARIPNFYTLSWVLDGGILISQDYYTQGEVAYGESIVAPASPVRDGYTFAGWSETPATTMPATDVVYTALWVAIAEPEPVVIPDNTETDISDIPVTPETEITVEPGGELNIDIPDIHITTIVIMVENGHSGQMHPHHPIHADNVYLDYQLHPHSDFASPDLWYAFSLPFPVDIATGITRHHGSPSHIPGVDFVIMEYDGFGRAQTGRGWRLKTEGTLQPGRFYMIGIEGNCNRWLFRKNNGADIEGSHNLPVEQHPSANPVNAGWNGIGNATLEYSDVSISGVTHVFVYDNERSIFVIYNLDDIHLPVGRPFFAQVGADGSAVFNHHIPYAPARRYGDTDPSVLVTLSEEGATEATGRMYLTITDNSYGNYTIGTDVQRMAGDGKNAAQLWCEAYGTQLSAHGITMDNGADVPLALYAPKDGYYTIAVNPTAMDGCVIDLVQDGAVIGSYHSQGDITLPLTAGTHRNYSLRMRRGLPTGCPAVEGEKNNGIWYDILGRPADNNVNRHGVYIRKGEKAIR